MRRRGARFLSAVGLLLCTATSAPAQPTDQPLTVLHLKQTAERTVLRDLLRIDLRSEAAATRK